MRRLGPFSPSQPERVAPVPVQSLPAWAQHALGETSAPSSSSRRRRGPHTQPHGGLASAAGCWCWSALNSRQGRFYKRPAFTRAMSLRLRPGAARLAFPLHWHANTHGQPPAPHATGPPTDAPGGSRCNSVWGGLCVDSGAGGPPHMLPWNQHFLAPNLSDLRMDFTTT